MSIACALSILPPYHGGGRRELLKRPKVYGFDTGFVTYARGWKDGGEGLFCWRDKSGREVDFVVRRGKEVDAVECKDRHGGALDLAGPGFVLS